MRILVIGASGLVATTFIKENKDSFDLLTPDLEQLDICDELAVKQYFDENSPEYVVNFAAFTNVEAAEDQKDDRGGSAYQINVEGPKNLANECKKQNITLLQISTEYVFDGEKSEGPYIEEDSPNPINWYGATKLFGEKEVKESGCSFLIIRICMPYAPMYELKKDIARTFLAMLRERKEINALTDVRITPTSVSDISAALRVLIDKGSKGIYHVSTITPLSPFDFATEIANQFNLDAKLIHPTTLENYNNTKKAAMLQFSWLSPKKFEREFGKGILHSVAESIGEFKKQIDSSENSKV